MKKNIVAAVAFCVAVSAWAQEGPALEDRFDSVSLPAGSELNLVISRRPDSHPRIAALLFPGYPGVLKIQQTAAGPSFQLRGNFLVRARRHLVDDQILTVMVDCPKVRWDSCDDAYRTSDQHAEDVGAVIDKVKADYGVSQIYLVGTSYGTVSSAFLARKLGKRIDGAVHTSTFTDPRVGRGQSHGFAMWNFDWNTSQAEQLFVHHRDDPCPLTRYRSIVARKGNAPLITVRGTQGARGEPCEAFSAHGFVGRERAVMLAIARWMESRKVEETVGAEGDEP